MSPAPCRLTERMAYRANRLKHVRTDSGRHVSIITLETAISLTFIFSKKYGGLQILPLKF